MHAQNDSPNGFLRMHSLLGLKNRNAPDLLDPEHFGKKRGGRMEKNRIIFTGLCEELCFLRNPV